MGNIAINRKASCAFLCSVVIALLIAFVVAQGMLGKNVRGQPAPVSVARLVQESELICIANPSKDSDVVSVEDIIWTKLPLRPNTIKLSLSEDVTYPFHGIRTRSLLFLSRSKAWGESRYIVINAPYSVIELSESTHFVDQITVDGSNCLVVDSAIVLQLPAGVKWEVGTKELTSAELLFLLKREVLGGMD